ncbi:MAG: carbohydrate ABC transporter permease [Planctomycetota bacterium]|nr:carbohydrate ABC transporter permease [Planctomycetota bacterium]
MRSGESLQRRPRWLSALAHGLAWLLVVLAVGPALWLMIVAFQPPRTDLDSVSGFSLVNFATAWTDGKLLWPMVNSFLVTLARAGLNVLIAALAAYPLARMKFRGRETLFVLLLGTMMIPEQVLVVPMFKTIAQLGLYDTLAAVVLPLAVTAFGIYLCRQAFLAIPDEVEEAARIDGAGPLRIWWSVFLPLIQPTLATLAIFSVIGAWSDLLWPLIVLQSRDNFTLPVALAGLMGQFSTNVRAAYAGSVIAMAPVVLFFVVAQRLFRPELMAGSVKG